jgi:hypothetical protein
MDLDEELLKWMNRLKQANHDLLNTTLSSLKSIYPFNKYEYIITFLLSKGVISFNEYEALRDSYLKANMYLELYQLSPRVFGDLWCREHLIGIDQRFKLPNKELDPQYNGEYDLWLDDGIKGIKIEVKAGRATETKKREDVISKALRYDDDKNFWINMQQIKLGIADVFIFIGVWTDEIRYWVLTNEELQNSKLLSHQHRGGIEYQVGITKKNIKEFDKYLVKPANLVDTILKKVKKT